MVYFADGSTELGAFHRWDGTSVPIEDMAAVGWAAVVATTDGSFGERDPGLLDEARALANVLRGRDLTVGDRLTERYVRQFTTAPEPGLVDRLAEWARLVRVQHTMSREQILEEYLSTAYFGRGAHGIEQGAHAFFGTGSSDITASQAAFLAGILPAPDLWDPAVAPDRARERWGAAVDAMIRAGIIDPGDIDLAADYPEVLPYSRTDGFAGNHGYLLDMVWEELLTVGLTEEELRSGGLTIVSTFDAAMQRAATEAVASLPSDRPSNNRTVLVSIEPATGAVRALHGGEDYLRSTRNGAVLDHAQGGSTFKPFALIAALESGIPLEAMYPSTTPLDVSGYLVSNVDGQDRGVISLREATANSVNTVFAQLNEVVGPERTKEVALRAGLPADTPGLDADHSNVFGTASPRPVDLASVFATYAAGGERHDRFVVAEVRDADGGLRHRGGTPGERVFDPAVMARATEAMSGVLSYGTAADAALPGRPAAGKTGTSDGNRSAWFCGYVPQLATVVAMYQVGPDGSEESLTPFGGVDPVMGGSYPAMVWQRYMAAATAGLPVLPLETAAEPADPGGSAESGGRPGSGSSSGVPASAAIHRVSELTDPCVARFVVGDNAPSLALERSAMVGCPQASEAGTLALAAGMRWLGTAYAWGGGDLYGPTVGTAHGSTTVGFDCSGLSRYSWANAGVELPRNSRAQWEAPGTRIDSWAELEPGDLVFFATDPSDPATIHHVALYVGDGAVLEAPTTERWVRVLYGAPQDPLLAPQFIGGLRPGA